MDESNQSALHRVELEETGQTVKAAPGTLLIDVLRMAGIDIAATCDGKGICGQCRVVISGGQLPQPSPAEMKHLAPAEQNQGVRLACCTPVNSAMKIRLPKKTASADARLQVDGKKYKLVVDPAIHTVQITLPPADPLDATSNFEQIALALEQGQGKKDLVADHLVAEGLSKRLDSNVRTFNACLRGRELVAVLEESAQSVGLAVDLGTTKVAGYLLDLTTGKTLASAGILNPQGRFGADIMTRLHHACNGTGKNDLLQVIRGGIDQLLHQLTNSAEVDPRQVVDACIVANTAMVHLLLDLPVRQLARTPYTPSTLNCFDIKARDIALNIAPGAYVHILPSIGGFVGADHVAMIMAAGIDKMDQSAIGLDIGTNTEIALKHPDSDNLYCLSCPSGPAFEAAHVANGMRAAAGAIEEVRLTDTFESRYKTIGHAPAIGLCGSAMIDVVSELYRCGLINQRGRFQDKIRLEDNGFLLVPPTESGTGSAIRFSQKDIDEILLAKGAIRAGIEILLQVSQTRIGQVRHVFIAGAFGAYINLTNAISIGLIPDFPSASYHQIGNAAALGAKQALLDRAARQRAGQIATHSHFIELTRQENFNRHFAQGIMLPEVNPKRQEK